MTNQKLIHCFRRDYRLFGVRWVRFCKRYGSRNIATVIQLIKVKYGEAPAEFRNYFREEIKKITKIH